MRVLLVAAFALLCTAACVLSSGPDCSEACDKVLTCKDLDKTFALSCSSVGYGCIDGSREVACAACVTSTSCADLVSGKCDDAPDGGPLCLVRDE